MRSLRGRLDMDIPVMDKRTGTRICSCLRCSRFFGGDEGQGGPRFVAAEVAAARPGRNRTLPGGGRVPIRFGVVAFGAIAAIAVVAVGARGAIDAHKEAEYRFGVTNRYGETQWVSGAGVSCGCVRAEVERGAEIGPGEVLEIRAVLNPAGREGPVAQAVWVELEPAGAREVFLIEETVRTRLGFKPSGMTFGTVKRGEAVGTVEAELAGYAAEGAELEVPRRTGGTEGEPMFSVELGEGGKSVVARLARSDALPGFYAETWRVETGDEEIPELAFPVSVWIEGAVQVVPGVLDVAADERGAGRSVVLRRADGQDFAVLSAETEPAGWGEAEAFQRSGGGWIVSVSGIDGEALRAMAGERPCLVIRTDVSGEEELRIPVRVAAEEGETR